MELDIRNLLTILIRRLWIIILCAALFASATLIYTQMFVTPIYASTVTVWGKTGDDSTVYQEAIAMQQMMQTYAEFVTAPVTLDKAASRLEELAAEINDDNIKYTADQLAARTTVTYETESQIFKITVRDANPSYAQLIANVVAESARTILSYDEVNGGLKVGIIEIIGKANLPDSAISPNTTRNTLIAAFIGIVASAIVCLIVEYSDTSIKTEEDVVSILSKPLIGTVPNIETLNERKAV